MDHQNHSDSEASSIELFGPKMLLFELLCITVKVHAKVILRHVCIFIMCSNKLLLVPINRKNVTDCFYFCSVICRFA